MDTHLNAKDNTVSTKAARNRKKREKKKRNKRYRKQLQVSTRISADDNDLEIREPSEHHHKEDKEDPQFPTSHMKKLSPWLEEARPTIVSYGDRTYSIIVKIANYDGVSHSSEVFYVPDDIITREARAVLEDCNGMTLSPFLLKKRTLSEFWNLLSGRVDYVTVTDEEGRSEERAKQIDGLFKPYKRRIYDKDVAFKGYVTRVYTMNADWA